MVSFLGLAEVPWGFGAVSKEATRVVDTARGVSIQRDEVCDWPGGAANT